jgi:hypothetical protein
MYKETGSSVVFSIAGQVRKAATKHPLSRVQRATRIHKFLMSELFSSLLQ